MSASGRKQALAVLLGLARRRLPALGLGLAALLLVDLAQLYVPRLIKFAVDDLAAGTATADSLLGQAGMVLALAAAMALLRAVWRPLIMGFARRAELLLRQHLFFRLQALDPAYFGVNPPGEIMARATNDLNNIRLAAGMGLVAAMDALVLGLLAVGFMVRLSPALAGLACLPLPVMVLITRLSTKRMHEGFLRTQETFAALAERARESLSAIRLVKTFALDRREAARLQEAALENQAANLGLARLMGFFFPINGLCMGLSFAVVLGLGGPLVVRGDISAGDFVAFASYLALLAWPMMALGWVVSLFQRAWASLSRVDEVISARPAITDPPAPRRPPQPLAGGIAVRGLSFAYPGSERPVLREVSLSIPAGRATALVGPVGSGKSTLLGLLGRLQDPPPGSIFLDGVDIREMALADLRAGLVQVPQEAFLFSNSLRDNLCLGAAEEVPEERLWAALAAASLDQEAARLPQGLATSLGEGGMTLSGGQRQRLCLARALLMDPPVLILDDPLSAVDTETERAILDNLARLRKGRTTLLVSHRLASVAFAGRIFVLDEGRVVEEGTHPELLARGGLYHRLFAEQALLEGLRD